MQRLVAATGGSALAIGLVVWIGLVERTGPVRCPDGTFDTDARCCALGQGWVNGRCEGWPARCPKGLVARADQGAGCVPITRRIPIAGGSLFLGPSDWEAQGKVEFRVIRVQPFEIDSIEVTHHRWATCVEDGVCDALESHEPGLPVTGVSVAAAAQFCRFAGGRLPLGDEWLMAACGSEGRRYPWGATGLVCRRAVFGTVSGPCSTGAQEPELAGLRPDGATPDGVLDLVGNVAEWTVEADHTYAARGGSFRSRVAGNLKNWSVEVATAPADHIGFRCAYDVETE